jgi:hypothetical protein
MLVDALQQGESMTSKEVLKAVGEQDNSKLTKGWVHSLIGRHLDVLQECCSFPLEDSRLIVPRDQSEEHINTMKTILASKFSELIVNVYEVGSSE